MACINVNNIITHKTDPSLATWVLAFSASLLSLVTYLTAENFDVIAGIANVSDIFATTLIVGALLVYGQRGFRIRTSEKYYFFALAIIPLYWYLSSNAFLSNLFVQILMALSYISAAHIIITSRRNNDSFVVWGLILVASIVSLYPATHAWYATGNILALIYSLRVVVFGTGLLALMYYFREKIKL
jgi:hypothetical protein